MNDNILELKIDEDILLSFDISDDLKKKIMKKRNISRLLVGIENLLHQYANGTLDSTVATAKQIYLMDEICDTIRVSYGDSERYCKEMARLFINKHYTLYKNIIGKVDFSEERKKSFEPLKTIITNDVSSGYKKYKPLYKYANLINDGASPLEVAENNNVSLTHVEKCLCEFEEINNAPHKKIITNLLKIAPLSTYQSMKKADKEECEKLISDYITELEKRYFYLVDTSLDEINDGKCSSIEYEYLRQIIFNEDILAKE